MEDGDKAGKIYLDEDFSSGSTLAVSRVLLANESTVEFSGTTTIPSGKELLVEGGTTLEFSQNADIFSSGKLTMVGSSQNQINLKSSGTGQFDYLYMYGMGANGSKLDYVNVTGSKHGIMVNDASVILSNVTSKLNENHGLKMWLGAGGTVTNFELDDNEYYGAYIDDSEDITFVNGAFFSNGSGLWARSNSTVYFGGISVPGGVVIEDSDLYGIAVYLDAFVKAGDNATGFGGNNTMFANGVYEVRATSGGQFLGENMYWANDPPSPGRFYADTASSIDYSPWLSSDPNKTIVDEEATAEYTPASFVREFNDALSISRERALELARTNREHQDPRIARKARVLETRELIRSDKRSGVHAGEVLLESEDFSTDDKAGIAKHLFHAYLLDLGDANSAERIFSDMAGSLRVEHLDLSAMETLFRD